jgi:hypothetical protein
VTNLARETFAICFVSIEAIRVTGVIVYNAGRPAGAA